MRCWNELKNTTIVRTNLVHPNEKKREITVRNITLSADENLIEAARRRAAAQQTTLNAQFRLWLADYVGRERQTA